MGTLEASTTIAHPMTELYNRTPDKPKRRSLRQTIPPAERRLWPHLRDRHLENCKFRRQYSIDRYVIDFYAPELKLAIEIDGPTHDLPGAAEYDADRQAFIEATGAIVLRFSNGQVYGDLEGVLGAIGGMIRRLRSDRLEG
jgi:very-short-patch-repair endonuclease